MGLNGSEKTMNEIEEESKAIKRASNYQADLDTYIATSQRGLLNEEKPDKVFQNKDKGFHKFIKFGSSSKLPSSSARFWKVGDEDREISNSSHCPPTTNITNQGSTGLSILPFVKKLSWEFLWQMFKQWIKDPLNIALFIWILCVTISGAILFLVMTGMLNSALPSKSERDAWFEVNNQILNALFTLMCLYQHPKRFHHLVLLCRWRSTDILSLRKVYCKNGTQKPNEWKHMMVVVILLHINCFAQYVLCGLNIGYPRSRRPAIGVGVSISIAIGAAAVAGVYNIISPLGKEYDFEMDQESQTSLSVEEHRIPVDSPQWIGGLFDFWDDISLAYMSFFCSCCVFGWNMDRLGFGNMYVHIATFLLFCLAPFFIFNLAAININNETVREILGLSGFVLCIFGLLYGGFWRIQMRKKFNLPGSSFCFGKSSVTDCFQWLCCCACSLAQEVRTADYYDVKDDKMYLKYGNDENSLPVLSPLPREDGSNVSESNPPFPYSEKSSLAYVRMQHFPFPIMKPPGTPFIHKEDSS